MAKFTTVKAIDALKPKEKEFKVTVAKGLYIRVAIDGTKTWLVRYVIEGAQKQATLPEHYGYSADCLTLSKATTLNETIQDKARKGVDYFAEKAGAKLADKQRLLDAENAIIAERERNKTVSDLYNVWIVDGVARADGNQYIKQSFSKHALSNLGHIPLAELSENHLINLYREVCAKGIDTTCFELSKDIAQMLSWAIKRKPWRGLMVDGNPADLVDIYKILRSDFTKVRERTLSIEEIILLRDKQAGTAQSYSQASQKYGVERPLKKEVDLAMWICLGTVCRIGELLMTQWQHVDFGGRTWFIPAENTKGEGRKKTSHSISLSDFTLDQFRQLHALTGDTDFAFPARYKAGHVCVKSASKQIGDRQVQFKQRTKKLQARVENNSLVLGSSEWTPHDLRRTGVTMMQQLGITPDIINLCQHHIIGSKVDKSYLQYKYDDEKRLAWTKLGDRLEAILSANNVVSLKVA